jgi:hypothetical protein
MNASDLKLDLIKKLDALDNQKFKQLYGEFVNIINQEESIEDWDKLSENQQIGLKEAEKQYKSGKFKSNEFVMNSLRTILVK